MRLIFKNSIFKDISEYNLTPEEVEREAVDKILSSGMLENGYELVYIED